MTYRGALTTRHSGRGLGGRGLLLRALGKRHGGGVQAAGEHALVARLEDAGLAQERARGVARLCADLEPVERALHVDVQRALTLTGSVLADDLEELAVARAARVGDDEAVEGGLLAAATTETDTNCHVL
jgi:hypothetical protein